MAEKPEIARRIDSYLAYITATVDDMRQIPDLWDGESEIIRTDWEMEWCEQMDRLALLEEQYRGGPMTAEQETRYQRLLAKLRDSLPMIRRLDLELLWAPVPLLRLHRPTPSTDDPVTHIAAHPDAKS